MAECIKITVERNGKTLSLEVFDAAGFESAEFGNRVRATIQNERVRDGSLSINTLPPYLTEEGVRIS